MNVWLRCLAYVLKFERNIFEEISFQSWCETNGGTKIHQFSCPLSRSHIFPFSDILPAYKFMIVLP